MKAVCFDGEKAVYREDVPKPERREDESLIRITLAAVCTTDLEILKGYRPDFSGVMGHEFTGIVEESEDPALVGKRVVGEINEVCHTCLYCRTGREHHCVNRQTIGLSRDGCFAEYMVLKNENLHVIPDSLPDETAVYTEPLAAAFEITEQVPLKEGTPVCVIGDGRLALCTAQVLHLFGAALSVVGKHPEKLDLFRPYAKPVLLSELPSGIPGPEQSYEIVVEASGSASGFETALRLVRSMGTIVLKSTFSGKEPLNLSEIPVREITVVGSRCGPFEKALKALCEGKIRLPEIDLYSIDDFKKAFASRAFKAGIRMK